MRIKRRRRQLGGLNAYQTGEAFSDLYEYSHLLVFRYICGLRGGPTEEAEDLTAETFFRAWRAWDRFEGSRVAAVGWLLQIARRLVIDGYRRSARGIHERLDETDLPDPDGSSEEQTLQNEQRQTLWNMLQSLPIEQREMVVLRYLVGWRVNEIAEHLGLTENNVSVSLRRALQRMRRDWPQYEGEKLNET